MRPLPILALLLAAGLSCWPVAASAQAYCALRDPTAEIYTLVPEADAYRSFVRVVDADAREAVAGRLPIRLHFNELGKHTLYVALSNDRPAAFVHARSEPGRWGLVEIVWAFDTDLRVRDFSFQRCRDPVREALEADSFRRQLRGRSFAEIRRMLDPAAEHLIEGALDVPQAAGALAAVVLRSALKTIAVTDVVWRENVEQIRTLSAARAQWPAAHSIERVEQPYTSPALANLAAEGMATPASLERGSLQLFRVRDRQGRWLGVVIDGHWKTSALDTRLLWVVDADGTVRGVDAPGGWSDPTVGATFEAVIGFDERPAASCASAVELAALEILLLARHSLEQA